MATACIKDLFESDVSHFVLCKFSKCILKGADAKTIPLINRLITPLRMALMSKSAKIFYNGLETLK